MLSCWLWRCRGSMIQVMQLGPRNGNVKATEFFLGWGRRNQPSRHLDVSPSSLTSGLGPTKLWEHLKPGLWILCTAQGRSELLKWKKGIRTVKVWTPKDNIFLDLQTCCHVYSHPILVWHQPPQQWIKDSYLGKVTKYKWKDLHILTLGLSPKIQTVLLEH